MKIWVDADACPQAVREIIANAGHRRAITTLFVANKKLFLPPSEHLSFVLVDKASDAADDYIRDNACKSDLVITQDIPLAHALVHKEVTVINPRGDKYSADNIGGAISMRNLMQDLRDSGEIRGGPKQFGDRERRAFAATFDREITRLIRLNQ